MARALEAAGSEYFLGGSLASSHQGEPRATNDIDFVLSMSESQVDLFERALGEDFLVDAESLLEAVREVASWNIIHAGVLRHSARMLDNDYLNRWATCLGIDDLLEAARRSI